MKNEEGKVTYDIRVRCYEFSKRVVLFIKGIEVKRIYASIIDQLLRSATSIGANVIEARSGNSRKNLISFYSVALRSANETKYWLCLIRDTMDVEKAEIKKLINEVNEISKIIASSIIKLKQNQEDKSNF